MLDKELAAFLEEGLSIYVATRNEQLEPNGARASAVRVATDGTHIEVFVPAVSAGTVMRDLRANGQIAVVLTRPPDDRGCQAKGVFVEARDASEGERAFVVSQWERFRDRLELIGLLRVATDGWVVWPSVAVRFRVNALFDQTPGPGAGAPLG
jgi:hypothetical protein